MKELLKIFEDEAQAVANKKVRDLYNSTWDLRQADANGRILQMNKIINFMKREVVNVSS